MEIDPEQEESLARWVRGEKAPAPSAPEPAKLEPRRASLLSKLFIAASLPFLAFAGYGAYSMAFRTPTIIETREYERGHKKVTANIIGYNENYPGIRPLDDWIHGFFPNTVKKKLRTEIEEINGEPQEYTLNIDARPSQLNSEFHAKNWKHVKENKELCEKNNVKCDRFLLPAYYALKYAPEKLIGKSALYQYLDCEIKQADGKGIYGNEKLAHFSALSRCPVLGFEVLEQHVSPRYSVAEEGTRKTVSKSGREIAKDVLSCIAFEAGFEGRAKIDYSQTAKLKSAARKCLENRLPTGKQPNNLNYISDKFEEKILGITE